MRRLCYFIVVTIDFPPLLVLLPNLFEIPNDCF